MSPRRPASRRSSALRTPPALSTRPGAVRTAAIASIALAALALLVSPAPARAATPSSGTVSETSPTVAWTGNPLPPTASAECGGPDSSACDNFALTVLPPSFPYEVVVTVTSGATDDYDLEVYDPSGRLAGSSGNPPGAPETVKLVQPPAGTYTVSVANFAAVGPYSATAELVATAEPPPPGNPDDAPSYAIHTPPAGVGTNSGEPSVGVNWNTDRALFIAGLETLRVEFDDCTSPARATWTDKSAPTTSIVTLDPILFTDEETGRTFASQLGPKCSNMAFTDDDGESWTLSQGCGINSGVDHQTVGGGPFAPPFVGGVAPDVYPNAVYYCSQDIALAQCARSDTGGLTFGPAVPIYTLTECGGLHGHVKVAPDGTVYVPNKGCNGEQAVVVSEDNGVTWDVRRVPGTSSGTWDPSVGIASDGTIYLGMTDGERPRIAVSRDKGLTWEHLQDVGIPFGIESIAFPVVAAGDPDRAAFGFLGTSVPGDASGTDVDSPHVWYPYVATTYDGGATWTTINLSPDDPVQRGNICAQGTTCGASRNLLDFNDMTVDREGRVVFAYADGCLGSCLKSPPNSGAELATIARQVGGKRLFAAFDAETTPAATRLAAELLDGGTADERVRLTWDEPFDGNSEILSYEILRRRSDETDATLLASVGADVRTYEDASILPGESYFYRVIAVNAFGPGASCGEVAPVGAPDAPDACVPPGPRVVVDPVGDTAAADATGDPSLDLVSVSMAEPFTGDGEEKLVVTIEVDDLSMPHPSAAWRALWSSPDGQQHFVSLETCDPVAGIACSYGTFDGTLFSSAGEPEGCEFSADGRITITVDKALVGISDASDVGTALSGVEGRVQIFIGGLCTGLLSNADSGGPGDYLLQGNASCAADAPVAVDDFATTTEGVPVVVDVLANDSPEGLRVVSVGDPAAGSVADNGDGTVTYVPDAGTSGTDSFPYTVEDAAGRRAVATVTVTVEPRCPPEPTGSFHDDFEPAAGPGWAVDTVENELLVASPPWAVVTDSGASSPTHSFSSDARTLARKDDRLLAPPQDVSATSRLSFLHRFEFEDTFDGGVLEVSTDGGSTWVDVTEGGAFVEGGYNGVVQSGFGSPIAGRPAWTGGSADEPMTRVTVDLGAFAGPAVRVRWRLAADDLAVGSLPGAGWWVDDVTFTDLLEPAASCPTNRAPEAADDTAATRRDEAVSIPVLANDSDPDGDALVLGDLTQPSNGTATANADGSVTYRPEAGFTGTDTFTYEACDAEPLCDEASVTVTVLAPENQAPTARDDSATAGEEEAVSIAVLANDSDPDGDALALGDVTQPSNGTATANADGTVTYRSDAGFEGTDTFTYEACDPEPLCDEASVTVTVRDAAGGDDDKVSGGGWIAGGGSDGEARFGFNAKRGTDGTTGRMTYDRGGSGIGLSGTVATLTVSGATAVLEGSCTLGDGSPCTWRAEVEDHATPGAGADRFAIEVRDAASVLVHANDGTLGGGDVRLH